MGIAAASFIPWVQVGVKITAYTSVLALFITMYDSSQVSFNIAEAEGSPQKQRANYVIMVFMKILLFISPFALWFWIQYENDEAVLAKISNYVTFAALAVVFFTRGMELKSQFHGNPK